MLVLVLWRQPTINLYSQEAPNQLTAALERINEGKIKMSLGQRRAAAEMAVCSRVEHQYDDIGEGERQGTLAASAEAATRWPSVKLTTLSTAR